MSYRPGRSWLRCNECRTRRSSIQLLIGHQRTHLDCKPCYCGGYHHPHRRGSTYCVVHPEGLVNQASRAGASDDDINELRQRMQKERECPF